MPTTVEYKTKWQHNRSFLATIDDDYPDWMVTVMFYTALHAVETLLVHENQGTTGNHRIRNQILKSTNRYKQIWKYYRLLYEAAIVARYHVGGAAWISVQDIKVNLAMNLYGVEKSVLNLIGSQEKFEKVW